MGHGTPAAGAGGIEYSGIECSGIRYGGIKYSCVKYSGMIVPSPDHVDDE